MKILFVNKFLFPNGGSETYIFKLGDYLKNKGHEVQYFGMEHKGRIVGNRVNAYTSDMDFHSSFGLSKLFYPIKTIYSAEARRQIRKVLNDFEPSVVHLNNITYQRINSHSQNNLFYKMNTNNIYNKNINNEHSLKNRKNYNHTINNRSVNYNNINSKKKLTFHGINTNYNNYNNYSNKLNITNNDKIYSKTDENMNLNSNLDNNKLKGNNYTNNQNTNNRVFSGLEHPIEKLKKKIMILEQQIKNNQE